MKVLDNAFIAWKYFKECFDKAKTKEITAA
jgi:hypothetical protein